MWVGGQRHALAALPPGKTRYPFCRRLGGPPVRSGPVRKISPPTGIRFRSESLYRLSYPGPQNLLRAENILFLFKVIYPTILAHQFPFYRPQLSPCSGILDRRWWREGPCPPKENWTTHCSVKILYDTESVFFFCKIREGQDDLYWQQLLATSGISFLTNVKFHFAQWLIPFLSSHRALQWWMTQFHEQSACCLNTAACLAADPP